MSGYNPKMVFVPLPDVFQSIFLPSQVEPVSVCLHFPQTPDFTLRQARHASPAGFAGKSGMLVVGQATVSSLVCDSRLAFAAI